MIDNVYRRKKKQNKMLLVLEGRLIVITHVTSTSTKNHSKRRIILSLFIGVNYIILRFPFLLTLIAIYFISIL